MKIRILFFLLLCVATIRGQVLVTKQYLIPSLEKELAFHPVFNAAGDQILVTSANYTGLALYDINTKTVKHITNDAGAGFDAAFSADGGTVSFRQSVMKEGRQLKVLKRFHIKKLTIMKLSEPLRTQEEQTQVQLRNGENKTLVSTEKLKLVLYNQGQRIEMEPAGKVAGYMWASLSPDNKMILFTAAAKGTFVCDLSGKIIASLGNLNAPVWYGNKHVVGMEDKDNGEVVTSSKIIIASIDGKLKQSLTPENRIAMYPTAAAVRNRVAYCTDQGEIYVMEIDLNQ